MVVEFIFAVCNDLVLVDVHGGGGRLLSCRVTVTVRVWLLSSLKMPGPSNAKRKAAKSKKKKTVKPTVKPAVETTIITESSSTITESSIIQSSNGSSSSPSPDLLLLTPPPLSILSSCISIPDKHPPPSMPRLDLDHIEEILCQKPFIHDPGNGPRVRDTRAFLASSYFSQPPALHVRHPVFRPALWEPIATES